MTPRKHPGEFGAEPWDGATAPTDETQPGKGPVEEPSAEKMVGAVDDTNATWWADFWPFTDETGGEPISSGPVGVAGAAEGPAAAPPPADPPDDDDESAVPLPAPWVAARASGTGQWWTKRFVWISSVALAAVVVAGLVVLRGGHETDDQARLLRGPTYASPIPLQRGTSYVRSRVLPSGDLLVTHWIRTKEPVVSVTMRTPKTQGLAPGSVSATRMVLAANGTRYPAIPTDGEPSGTQTLRFPPARTVYLRYRLSGVMQAGGPGGRALARITSLDVTPGSGPLTTTQIVVGAKVLALACTSGPPDTPAVPCGSMVGGSWTVRLVGGQQPSRVMAQVDLLAAAP